MVEITDKEYELFQKLKKIWFHSKPDWSGSYFICGEAGEKDDHGLPNAILVCPEMGSNLTAVYERPNDKIFRSGQ